MEKQSILRAPRMEKFPSFNGVPEKPSIKHKTMEKHLSFRCVEEKPSSTRGLMEKHPSFQCPPENQTGSSGLMEKQKSFRGLMEKQKNFRVVMERQRSFIGVSEKRKSKESPGKRGDLQLHLAARAGNLSRIKEILQNCDENDLKQLLLKQNTEGETPVYAAAENGHAMVVREMLKHMDFEAASIIANNGYDPLHVAAKQGHLAAAMAISIPSFRS